LHVGLFAIGIGIALAFLVPLGWKWRVQTAIVLFGALFVGAVSGAVVGVIHAQVVELNIIAWAFVELAFVGLLTVAAIYLRFYRDPERVPPETENVLLAPADGEVIYVNEVEAQSSVVCTKRGRKFEIGELMSTDLMPELAYLIGIDMNVLDIHVNRAPVAGKIVLQKRTEGKFISLRRPESNVVNERVTTVLDNGEFKVGVIQIASRLVRRIVSFLKEGDTVSIGQRIGMIKFGSQVDVAIPRLTNLRITTRPGERVKAGITIIARYGDQPSVAG